MWVLQREKLRLGVAGILQKFLEKFLGFVAA